MRAMAKCGAISMLLLSALTAGLSGQVVRGAVLQSETATPVVGAFVVLLDSTGSRRRATLTNVRGEYILRAPAAGTFQVLVELIGHKSTTSPQLQLQEETTIVHRIEIPPEAVALDTIVVSSEHRCRLSAEAGGQTQRVWQEARKALAVAAWAEADIRFPYQAVIYERTRDLSNNRLVDAGGNVRRLRAGIGKTPFYGAAAGDLAKHGYIRASPSGGYQYYGLDATALLSDAFLDDHCFQLVESNDGTSVGLKFGPLPGNDRPDVAGVLWLDRTTFALERVEYSFTRHLLSVNVPNERFGGAADFKRLTNGVWVVVRWQLRLPQFVAAAPPPPPSFHNPGAASSMSSVQRWSPGQEGLFVREEGGEIAFIAAPPEVAGDKVIDGLVYDSTRARPLVGATVFVTTSSRATRTDLSGRFRLTGLPSGLHEVAFFHAYTDALGLGVVPRVVDTDAEAAPIQLSVPAAAACAPADEEPVGGGVLGFAEDAATGEPAKGAIIVATWRIRHPWKLSDVLRGISPYRRFSAQTVADEMGRFVLCQLPTGVPVQVRAGRGPSVTVGVQENQNIKQDLIAG